MYLTFTEPTTPRYIHINTETNLVHLLVPIVGGEEISTDNTCRSKNSLVNFFGAAALEELNKYKVALEFDMALLDHVNPEYDKKKERLAQVLIYIDSVNRMRRSYDIAIDAFMARPSLNLYGIQLRPRLMDSASKVINPAFNVQRGIDNAGSAVSVLYNAMHRAYPYLMTRFSPAEQLKATVLSILSSSPSPSFELIQNSLGQQCIALYDLKIDFKIQANGERVTQDSIQRLMGFQNNASTEDYIDALMGACALNAWDGVLLSPFYTIPSTPIELRTEKLSILTQFFLAHLNIYCKAKQIGLENFGQILDAQPALSHQLVVSISQAFNKGDDIEKKICGFFNEYRNAFGLKLPLQEKDVLSIKQKFIRTYSTITATNENPRRDDFLILDLEAKGESALCVTHQASICVNFAEIVDSLLPNQVFFAKIRKDFLMHSVEISPHNKKIAGGIDLEPCLLRERLNDAQFATLPDTIKALCPDISPPTAQQMTHFCAEQKINEEQLLLDVPSNTLALQDTVTIEEMQLNNRQILNTPNSIVLPVRDNLALAQKNWRKNCKLGEAACGTASLLLGGLLGAGLFAVSGAASGSVGALISQAATGSKEDYPVEEATKIGAIGCGVIGAVGGAVMGAVKYYEKTPLIMSDNDDSNSKKSYLFFPALISYIASTSSGGLLGWAIINNNGETMMSLFETAKVLAIGSVATMFPVPYVLLCISIPLVLACSACFNKENNTLERNKNSHSLSR